MIIAELATSLLQLDQRIQGLDQQIAATFRRHHQARTIESMPGFGPILGAQLLVAAGRPAGLPQRRPPGRCSRAGAGPQRLRPTIRQPAQTAPLQPAAAARVLSIRADQHDASRSQPGLLPEETRWRSHPRPGRHHTRPPPHRRPLGSPTRRSHLQRRPAQPRCRGLTTSLRFPVAGHRPIFHLGGPLADRERLAIAPPAAIRVVAFLPSRPPRRQAFM